MQLTTIQIEPEVAQERVDEYRESLRHDRNAEDEAILRAYKFAAMGRPIIRLSEAIHAGGYFDNGLPKLAAVRADARGCWVYTTGNGSGMDIVFTGDPQVNNRGAMVGHDSVRVTVPQRDASRHAHWNRAVTIVPHVPPKLRPRRLHRFHILWEVEEWRPVPPVDPALIKHIGGDLWAVWAVWDLTELERAVIVGTR